MGFVVIINDALLYRSHNFCLPSCTIYKFGTQSMFTTHKNSISCMWIAFCRTNVERYKKYLLNYYTFVRIRLGGIVVYLGSPHFVDFI